MTPPISVQELKSGLFRVLWNVKSSISHRYDDSLSGNFSKVDLTTFGVDECYKIQCSISKYDANYLQSHSLKLTFETFDENLENFKRRKVTAAFLGCDKEMLFTSKVQVDPKKTKIPLDVRTHARQEVPNQSTRNKEVSRQGRKVCLEWTAQWPETAEIFSYDCSTFKTFEILIDMEPYWNSSSKSVRQRQQSVLSHLAHLWESKTLADVTFRCQNRDIKAHTLIVSSGSSVLAAMFQSDFKEKKERIAVINETKADVFEMLLYFIYTGIIIYDFKELCQIAELLVAADMYNVDSLKDECDLYLSKHVTLEEATGCLILSHLYNAKRLHQATLNFMQRNSEVICSRSDWMSLLKEYPELGFVAMQFMVKKNVQ